MALFRKRQRKVGPTDDRLGLVVPPKAVIIYDSKGEVVWDGVAEAEALYRKYGASPVEFEEEEKSDGTI